jgi:hypothetical protein
MHEPAEYDAVNAREEWGHFGTGALSDCIR